MTTFQKSTLSPTNDLQVSCPLPFSRSNLIRLGHGSGGKLSADLIENIFLPALGNPILNQMDDAALLTLADHKLAFTCDSYVVNPIFFPGGNIGSLAVHGTVNDLAMFGAKPLWLSCAFILEEGLPIDDLQSIVASMRDACQQIGVQFVAGDTKVVNRGQADKIFISTSGIGVITGQQIPKANQAKPGDTVIVSGDLGLHGMAIMCAREEIELETEIESDSAPLHELVQSLLAATQSLHCLRDITRGGLASVTNELAVASGVGIELDECLIPIHPQVKAACELLGLDPLYVACEGRLLAIAEANDCETILEALRQNPLGQKAARIGRVVEDHKGRVVLRSQIGGKRILDKLSGEQLPRIC
jgi:hydrogenase expression/formation protein HypE